DAVWKKLEGRLKGQGGLKVGEQTVGLKKLAEVLGEIPRPTPTNPYDWPLVGGNLTRTAQAKGSQPLLDEVLFSRPTNMDKSDFADDLDEGVEAKVWIDGAVNTYANQPTAPVLPGFFPVAAGGKLIYRSYLDVRAVNIHDVVENGKVVEKAGTISWK